MFNKKVLFVLGAGASHEVGLPTGESLKKVISKMLDIRFDPMKGMISGDSNIVDALKIYDGRVGGLGSVNPYRASAIFIRDAMPQENSIDDFLDAHRDNRDIELCGKLAICRAILKAERDSLLYIDPRVDTPLLNFEKLHNAWHQIFWRILNQGIRKENISKIFSNISFIVFNYDRCLEHFLFHSLINRFGISETEAQDLLATLEIFHPYGKVGNLPWEDRHGPIDYGQSISPGQLLDISKQIITYNERKEDPETVTAMGRVMEHAEGVIFLGFAFHNQNIDLISPEGEKGYKTVLGTGMGVPPRDRGFIANKMRKITRFEGSKENINIMDLTCQNLFHLHRHEISSW